MIGCPMSYYRGFLGKEQARPSLLSESSRIVLAMILLLCGGGMWEVVIERGYTSLTRYERRPLPGYLMFGRVGVPAHEQIYAF
ncbi:MAG: hypothetical protein CV081_12000 [Nitrospira sp. LK265]|nr:hypothetical protein [Nitrospira sp. LK265]